MDVFSYYFRAHARELTKKESVVISKRYSGACKSIYFCLGLMVLGVPPHAAPQERAQVGFGSTIRDDAVADVLGRHDIRARAAFIWTNGLSGSHRVHQGVSGRELVVQARAETIKFMEDSIKGNDRRMRDFLVAHTEDEVSSSQDLQKYARGLLNIRSQLEGALAEARSGQPLLFGVEVEGTPEQLQLLRSAPAVKVFSEQSAKTTVDVRGRARASVQSVKPEAYKRERMSTEVSALAAKEVYSRIKQKTGIRPQE